MANKVISGLTAALVFVLALGAFVLSYNALRSMAADNGITGWQSYIWPLLVDFALITFSLSVVRANLQGEKTLWPWLLVGIYTVATIGFNVLHAPPNLTAQIIAAVAPVSLFLSFELLMSQLRTEVSRHDLSLTLSDLTRQIQALTNNRDKIVAEVDTLTRNRVTLKKDIAALQAQKSTPIPPNVSTEPESLKARGDAARKRIQAQRREQVAELWQEGVRVKADLARTLSVSPKTISRDIKALRLEQETEPEGTALKRIVQAAQESGRQDIADIITTAKRGWDRANGNLTDEEAAP